MKVKYLKAKCGIYVNIEKHFRLRPEVQPRRPCLHWTRKCSEAASASIRRPCEPM